MPSPRVFISSTCYDLQEVRYHVRRFVSEVGYEPVMSEFGDIFYDFSEHVQDACRREIERCQLFVLLVGNRYGNVYHKHQQDTDIPDSITLQEFRKALSVGVPKFVFINRFVLHDYSNYRRALADHMQRHFTQNDVEDEAVERVRAEQRQKFDKRYPFPQESYRFVFHFLDVIHALDKNNAIFEFETVEEVRDALRRQWAAFMHDALTREANAAPDIVAELRTKLDRIEHQIRMLTEGTKKDGDPDKVTIDLRQLVAGMDLDDLESTQQRIRESLRSILWDGLRPRVTFREQFSIEEVRGWLEALEDLVRRFKWSSVVPVTEIFSTVPYTWYRQRHEVPFRALLELQAVYASLDEEDQALLANTVQAQFAERYEAEQTTPFDEDDDLPF